MDQISDYSYVAYIDEAGDDGLKRIRPLDSNGSSEWLMVSGVVIKASREREVKQWVEGIQNKLWRHNARSLHFAKLSSNKKKFVCSQISELKARYFVVCSNKKNMKGYQNPLASKIPSRNWFYCWMTRILLERITDFVAWKSQAEFGEIRKVKIEYSNRGGLSYDQMGAYFRWISYQGDNTFLKFGKINWETIDFNLLKVYPHYERAGLQLADIVASSFFKACDRFSTGECDPSFAKILQPRMARFRDHSKNSVSGYGVKLLPSFKGASLLDEQQEVFRFYGYPRQWWDPASFNQSGL